VVLEELKMAQFTFPVSDSDFNQSIQSGLVLVDFWAAWCGPCKAIAPKLEEIGKEMQGSVKILKMDVDQNPVTPGQFGIRAIPTLILFKNGQVVDQVMGNVPKEDLVSLIKKHS
jgi:thioredoxin 1